MRVAFRKKQCLSVFRTLSWWQIRGDRRSIGRCLQAYKDGSRCSLVDAPEDGESERERERESRERWPGKPPRWRDARPVTDTDTHTHSHLWHRPERPLVIFRWPPEAGERERESGALFDRKRPLCRQVCVPPHPPPGTNCCHDCAQGLSGIFSHLIRQN